jgi:hypothetical protein
MRSPLFALATGVVLVIAACDAPPVSWSDPSVIPAPPGTRLVVDTAGHARFVPDSTPAPPINAIGICPASVRFARGTTKIRAVWWGIRADSSAVLYLAASPDSGATWSAPLAVDTGDVSVRGCQRPPPSVAAAGDDVHIAYAMTASEGTGVFFAHFLGSMVHAPVAVIYGDHLVATAVAVDGDRVAVAYEDPNGTRHRVGVAISSSQGHIFDARVSASRDIDDASQPSVALAGQRLAVAWVARQGADSAQTRVVRVGRIH